MGEHTTEARVVGGSIPSIPNVTMSAYYENPEPPPLLGDETLDRANLFYQKLDEVYRYAEAHPTKRITPGELYVRRILPLLTLYNQGHLDKGQQTFVKESDASDLYQLWSLLPERDPKTLNDILDL